MNGFEQKGWVWVTLLPGNEWKISSPVLSTEQEGEQFAALSPYWAFLNNFTQQKLIQVSIFEGSAVVA